MFNSANFTPEEISSGEGGFKVADSGFVFQPHVHQQQLASAGSTRLINREIKRLMASLDGELEDKKLEKLPQEARIYPSIGISISQSTALIPYKTQTTALVSVDKTK